MRHGGLPVALTDSISSYLKVGKLTQTYWSIDILAYAVAKNNASLAPYILALQFGLMVDLPVAVIASITLHQGVKRFQEFWRFYEIKYGIGIRGITWVYTPIGLLGIMGPFMIFIGT